MKKIKLLDNSIVLKSDLAGEKPIYFYKYKDEILYSNNLSILLENIALNYGLEINKKSMFFLLQNGVIPVPYTIYTNLYILGIGFSAEITRDEIKFSNNFPFYNKYRKKEDDFFIDEQKIIDDLSEALCKRIDTNKNTFLFHSAGKDSNMIALALKESDIKDIIFISHKSKGEKDESEISKDIAKKLGFKHIVLNEIDTLNNIAQEKVVEYFTNINLPNVDNVALAYPLYTLQVDELYGANIIDGGGNDTYMCTPPNNRELKMFPLSKALYKISFIKKYVNSENILNSLLKSPLEWFAMWGLGYKDIKSILNYEYDCSEYWYKEYKKRTYLDLFDLKTEILTVNIAHTVHIGKVRNFNNMINGNLIMPFMDEKVASYYKDMPEKYLFDRKTYKNKLIFRKILKEKLGLDSDKIGKKGYSYDSRTFVLKNMKFIEDEILKYEYWDKNEIIKLFNRLKKKAYINKRVGFVSSNMIYRLFLISGWINYNKYFNLKKR
jgi:asparagine synthase (glutamine-hydrolysing)